MDEKLKGILQVVITVILVILIFQFANQLEQFKSYGYAGVFIISLISSASLFFPAPGWAVVIAMARFSDPILLGLSAGIGSALGEITGYIAGQGASKAIHMNSHFIKIKEWIRKNDSIALFLLAAIPNPLFDIAGIAAGSLGIPLWRFFVIVGAGRILRYTLLGYLGLFSVNYF